LGVVLMIPPKYQSEARVLVIGRDNIYLRPDADKDIIDRGVVDQEAVTSQAQLILSRDLASEVIAKLKLNELPEFDPALGNISLTKRVLGFLGVIRNPLAMTPEERVLEAFYDRLTVFPVEKSRVIVIDFLSENPELAARVANAIADAYLKRQQEAKQDQARSAGQWLSGEIDSLRKKVADSEAKVEAFRARSNLLVGPNNTTLSVQQLGDLNTQLATARAQKSDAEAKAKLIRDMLKSGEPIESSDVLNSELIRRLSEQRVTSLPNSPPRSLATIRASRNCARRSPISTSRSGKKPRSSRARSRTTPSSPMRGSPRSSSPSTNSRNRPRPRTRTMCSCARSIATPNRSAICWSPISQNIATPAHAARLIPRRWTRASFRAPPPRAYRLIRRSFRLS
jgi:hypothetical protein